MDEHKRRIDGRGHLGGERDGMAAVLIQLRLVVKDCAADALAETRRGDD